MVVEHDEDTIRAADYLVDIGPGAGVHGGEVIAEGSLDSLLAAKESLTGAYLSGRSSIPTPASRRDSVQRKLRLIDCKKNNLKNFSEIGRASCRERV